MASTRDDFFKPYKGQLKRHITPSIRSFRGDTATEPRLEHRPNLRRTSSAPPAHDRTPLPPQLLTTTSSTADQAPIKSAFMTLTKAHAERQAHPLSIDTSGAKIPTKSTQKQNQKQNQKPETQSHSNSNSSHHINHMKTTASNAQKRPSHTLLRVESAPVSAISPTTISALSSGSPASPSATIIKSPETPATPATAISFSPSERRLSRQATLTFSLPSASPSSRRGSTYKSPLAGRKLSGATIASGKKSWYGFGGFTKGTLAEGGGDGDVGAAERGQAGAVVGAGVGAGMGGSTGVRDSEVRWSDGGGRGFWGSTKMWRWVWALVALCCSAGVAVAVVCWWFGV